MDIQDNENDVLELLRDELEYLQVQGGFFDGQTEVWGKLIYNQEVKEKEISKELQELIDEFNERQIEKQKLTIHLKNLRNDLIAKENELDQDTQRNLIRVDGFFSCPECPFKTKYTSHLNRHKNAVHRKLKPWRCVFKLDFFLVL